MALVVTDTSCLIALERIGRLALLPALFDPVWAPEAVAREFGWRPDWLIVQTVDDREMVERFRSVLDPGEAEAIVLALSRPDSFLLVDELRARREASRHGLQMLGTVGLLLLARQQNQIAELKPVLLDLQRVGFRLSERLIHEVLHLAGERP